MTIHRNMPLEEAENLKKAKERASLKALEYVEEGMLLGLGTGSTASLFIDHLIANCRKGLNISAVATSIHSEQQAKKGGIPILDINQLTKLDLTIDGADEIDKQKNLIKGKGGALVREKIIANMSKSMLVIVDETKLVSQLGQDILPLEILPFGARATLAQIEEMGFLGKFREKERGSPYLTDNDNWILDLKLAQPPNDPIELHKELILIPGVIETGFFFHLATRCIIGKKTGEVEILD